MRSYDSVIILLIIITIDVICGDPLENKQCIRNMVYNDGDVVVLRDGVIDNDNVGTWNENIDLNKFIPPISDSDMTCIMHVDTYCSQAMARIKGLLIKALKDDCENCTIKERESIGKIVASMWAHDTESWKLFLTRFDSNNKLERII